MFCVSEFFCGNFSLQKHEIFMGTKIFICSFCKININTSIILQIRKILPLSLTQQIYKNIIRPIRNFISNTQSHILSFILPAKDPLLILTIKFSLKYSLYSCFHPWCLNGWVGGQREKDCLDCISEIVTLVGGCRSAASWCDLDLTFDLAVVILSLKILSGLYLGNCKV